MTNLSQISIVDIKLKWSATLSRTSWKIWAIAVGIRQKKLHVLPLNQRSPNGNTASNFWRKFPFFSKWICQTFPYFGESVATSLSTGYNLDDPVQKCRQFRRNLSESVWGYSPVLLQYKQWIKKTDARYVGQQKKSGWRKVSNHAQQQWFLFYFLNQF